MNQDIISTLQIEKTNLYDKYKVTRLGVFGSFARGEETPDSDIDILVEFSEIPGMIDFLKTEEYLETVLNRKIDLVRENAIRPELKSVIMSEVIMI
jgi:predicted nucleotidyltransferase